MKIRRVIALTALAIPYGAAAAFAATSGTPLDSVATQIMQIVSGPIALLLIIAGFAGAGIIYFLGRNFEVAFVTLAALAIGGGVSLPSQTKATLPFPPPPAPPPPTPPPALPLHHPHHRHL